MPTRFDILTVATNGQPTWLESAESMELALKRANVLRANLRRDCVILSQATGKKMVVTAKGEIRRD